MHCCTTIEDYSIRFPYSDISGSKVAWHLPEAFRRHAASFIAFLKPRHPPYALKHSSPTRKGCLRTAIICCCTAMKCLPSSRDRFLNLHFYPRKIKSSDLIISGPRDENLKFSFYGAAHLRVHKKTHIGSVRVME